MFLAGGSEVINQRNIHAVRNLSTGYMGRGSTVSKQGEINLLV